MKSFNLDDQRRFARLSGDYNPLHLDPLYCRRLLFGEPIVHGIHILLWSLKQILDRYPSRVVLEELKATFRNPLPLNTPIEIETAESTADGLSIQCKGNYCKLSARLREKRDSESWSCNLPAEAPRPECEELSFREAARGKGRVSLFLDQGELRAMFPHVAEKLPPVQVAQVLATTRLTGMECPGLHTIYHCLELHFAENTDDDTQTTRMDYEACNSDERFSVIEIAVRGHGLRGKLSTFFRPPPARQPTLAEIALMVRSGEFAAQRALVVGGSRGLGELTAKIIAAGGGALRITYHRGRQDAQRVTREIADAGIDCGCFPLDVTQELSDSLEAGLGRWKPTHVYYFATPHIGSLSRQGVFSPQRFAHFCRYYVDGLAAVVEALRRICDSSPAVFYPSSVFVDTLVDGTAEYSAAKAAGECLCRHLNERSRLGKFHAPRLPRLKTDQTASIGPQPLEDSLEVMLREIRTLEHMR